MQVSVPRGVFKYCDFSGRNEKMTILIARHRLCALLSFFFPSLPRGRKKKAEGHGEGASGGQSGSPII